MGFNEKITGFNEEFTTRMRTAPSKSQLIRELAKKWGLKVVDVTLNDKEIR
jgi:hypothetical protein